MRLVDDSLCLKRQLDTMLGVRMESRMFADSRPLLESLGSPGQIEEKALRQSLASLNQNLEDKEVHSFSWNAGTKIVADVFKKQGSQREDLEKIVKKNVFKHAKNEDNMVYLDDGEIKIKNLRTKAERNEGKR